MTGTNGFKIERVTVYCSSSSYLDASYVEAAGSIADALARSGRALIYGGGKLGLMGEVARRWREAGGRVVGVITDRLREAEQMDQDNHENFIVTTMRERKAMMEQRGDAFVILPGGLGTLEEFAEILVGRLVGEHDKPIVLVNTPEPGSDGSRGFYDPLLTLLDHMIAQRFAKSGTEGLFEVVTDAGAVLEALERAEQRSDDGPVDRRHLMPGLPGNSA